MNTSRSSSERSCQEWSKTASRLLCRAGTSSSDEPRPPTPDQEQLILKVLSCLARMERHAGKQGFGVDLLAKTLTGSKERKVLRWGFDQLTTYGILAPAGGPVWTVGEVSDVIGALCEAGCLHQEYVTRDVDDKQVSYRELFLTERAWQVMKRQGEPLELRFPHAAKLDRRRSRLRNL